MNWRQFYYDFAAAYGTIWLVLIGVGVVSRTYISTGNFGLFGFPLMAGAWAVYKSSQRQHAAADQKSLEQRVAQLEAERRDVGM